MGILSQMMTNIYKPPEQKKPLQALPKNLTPAKAAQLAAQTSLSQGQLLRGEVMDLRANQIMVLLENGATVTARTEGTLELSIGQNAQFLVAQTTDEQILLKHVKGEGSSENPMIDKALQAAGIIKTDRSVAIVTELLAHQQPVNEAGIRHYLSLSAKHPELPIKDLILMELHHIPVTKENTEQFLNYHAHSGKLLTQAQNMIRSLAKTIRQLPEGNVKQEFVKALQNLLAAKGTGTATSSYAGSVEATGIAVSDTSSGFSENVVHSTDTKPADSPLSSNAAAQSDSTSLTSFSDSSEQTVNAFVPTDSHSSAPEASTANQPADTKNTFFKDLDTTDAAVSSEPETEIRSGNTALNFPGKQPAEITLDTVFTRASLEKKEEVEPRLQDFLDSFLLKPEDIADPEKVQNYYEELNEKLEQLEQLSAKLSETAKEAASDAPKQMRSNLNFMEAVNQVFPYVQLPLKFRESAAHGELYVYEKKRSLKPSDSLSALLHLELEALGTTDIFVTLTGTHVTTRFSMTDKASGDLILQELPSLTEALAKSGYTLQSEVSVRNPEEAENTPTLLEQFLEDHAPGGLNRYSFDIRA